MDTIFWHIEKSLPNCNGKTSIHAMSGGTSAFRLVFAITVLAAIVEVSSDAAATSEGLAENFVLARSGTGSNQPPQRTLAHAIPIVATALSHSPHIAPFKITPPLMASPTIIATHSEPPPPTTAAQAFHSLLAPPAQQLAVAIAGAISSTMRRAGRSSARRASSACPTARCTPGRSHAPIVHQPSPVTR